jgi:crossover junction endodeoxyribonuclease RuvC
MKVLGIDPGLSRCGFGVVRRDGPTLQAAAHGVIRTPVAMALPERLARLAVELDALLDDHRPDAVAVERVFFQNNARTAMSVGQASGLALAAAARRGLRVEQYTPNEVKQAVTGWGAAPKEQVQAMVRSLLGLAETPRPPDAADALALALCHCTMAPLRDRVAAAAAAEPSAGPPGPAAMAAATAGRGGGRPSPKLAAAIAAAQTRDGARGSRSPNVTGARR